MVTNSYELPPIPFGATLAACTAAGEGGEQQPGPRGPGGEIRGPTAGWLAIASRERVVVSFIQLHASPFNPFANPTTPRLQVHASSCC
jgi:hypothetical protein